MNATALSIKEPDSQASAPKMHCPVCGSTEFRAFRERENAECVGCGTLERTRVIHLALQKLKIGSVSGDVYHFAPEVAVARKLFEQFGENYKPCDIMADGYRLGVCKTIQFDLCADTKNLESNSLAAVLHSHVLEHLVCNVSTVLRQLNRALKVGGVHVLCVPFFSDYHREDLSPDLPVEERWRLFGQHDHVRSFGRLDFEKLYMDDFAGFRRVEVKDLISVPELESIGGHPSWYMQMHGNIPLCFIKERDA